jgi:putative restriction endonuclease
MYLDPFNGLRLTPNLDKLFDQCLFDQCLISFRDDGSILFSTDLSDEMKTVLGVHERNRLRFVRPETLP